MQYSEQFLLYFSSEGDMAHFELRHDDGERPFHLSCRPASQCFVVNVMHDGAWGNEEVYPFAPGFRPGDPILVYRDGERVAVFSGERTICWTIPPDPARPTWPVPAASGVRVVALVPRAQAGIHWPADGGPPRLRSLALPACRRLALHDQVPVGLAVQLLDEIATHGNAMLRKVAACGRVEAIASRRAPGLALLLATLMPRVPLWLLGEEPARLGALAKVARGAGVDAVSGGEADETPPPHALIVGRALAGAGWPDACSLHDIEAPDTGPGVVPRQPARTAKGRLPAAASERASSGPHDGAHALRPGLDVIVALYNTQNHVADCLSSVLDGAPADMRVLVVDDGSTDASAEIVVQRFAHTPKVKLLRKPNGGCASARNYGRLMSDRSHIAFVDADDMVDPGFFAALHDVARATAADVVQGGFDLFDPAGSPPRRFHHGDHALVAEFPTEPFAGEQAMRLPPARLLRSQPSVWRAVYRRAFLDAHAIWFPESIRAYDDFLFHLRCLLHLREVLMVPERRYLYRQHPGQDIRRRDGRHFGNLAMASMLLQRMPSAPAETVLEVRRALVEVIDWSVARLEPELQGGFLQAAAELCVTLDRLPVEGAPTQPSATDQARTIVRHPDFVPILEQAQAQVADCPAGPGWAWATPALGHPGFVQQCTSQRRAL